MRDARLGFSPYDGGCRDRCLAVFDTNFPEFFAPNERVEYVAFLDCSPFFARFGAVEARRTSDGWGPGMHRVDMVLAVAREPAS
jgi:hypothetical protein